MQCTEMQILSAGVLHCTFDPKARVQNCNKHNHQYKCLSTLMEELHKLIPTEENIHCVLDGLKISKHVLNFFCLHILKEISDAYNEKNNANVFWVVARAFLKWS